MESHFCWQPILNEDPGNKRISWMNRPGPYNFIPGNFGVSLLLRVTFAHCVYYVSMLVPVFEKILNVGDLPLHPAAVWAGLVCRPTFLL